MPFVSRRVFSIQHIGEFAGIPNCVLVTARRPASPGEKEPPIRPGTEHLWTEVKR
jgi:hypothetical protein